MTGKKMSIRISVAASIVLCLGNATAQPITDLIMKGDVSGVETFAQTHDINELYYDYTPLCYAVKCDKESIVKLLIRSGANLEKACHGKTPLMFAAKNEFVHMIDLLIEAGASVDNPNQFDKRRLSMPASTAISKQPNILSPRERPLVLKTTTETRVSNSLSSHRAGSLLIYCWNKV